MTMSDDVTPDDESPEQSPSPYELLKVEPLNIKCWVEYDCSGYEIEHFEDVGQIIVDDNTGDLHILDRYGIEISKFNRGKWSAYKITEYTIPGDHATEEQIKISRGEA